MLLQIKTARSLLAILMIVISIFSTLWTFLEASGQHGSKQLAFSIGITSLTIVATTILLARALRWSLLFVAVKQYVQSKIIGGDIKENTILLGCGPGGALAVGMVSKALQKLGHKVPLSVVVDCEYKGVGDPITGTLISGTLNIKDEDCLIVHSYLGTGRSLHVLRNLYGLKHAPVFSFVISEALFQREHIDHYLHVGNREIIPWEKSVPHHGK